LIGAANQLACVNEKFVRAGKAGGDGALVAHGSAIGRLVNGFPYPSGFGRVRLNALAPKF
jgi:hypothetical protein